MSYPTAAPCCVAIFCVFSCCCISLALHQRFVCIQVLQLFSVQLSLSIPLVECVANSSLPVCGFNTSRVVLPQVAKFFILLHCRLFRGVLSAEAIFFYILLQLPKEM